MNRKEVDDQLQDACVKYANDPLGYVNFMWDWGHGELKDWKGPDKWHRELYGAITEYLEGPETTPLFLAVCSGHGAAKTFLVATIMHWFMSCRAHPQVVCTANTESQLTTKTWRELAK